MEWELKATHKPLNRRYYVVIPCSESGTMYEPSIVSYRAKRYREINNSIAFESILGNGIKIKYVCLLPELPKK